MESSHVRIMSDQSSAIGAHGVSRVGLWAGPAAAFRLSPPVWTSLNEDRAGSGV